MENQEKQTTSYKEIQIGNTLYRVTSVFSGEKDLGKTLAQLCDGDTSKLSAEQKRIEAELEAFRKNIFGDPERKDSLDSIANANPANVKAAKKAKAKSEKRNNSRRSKISGTKSSPSGSSSSGSGSARVSVRRQRH